MIEMIEVVQHFMISCVARGRQAAITMQIAAIEPSEMGAQHLHLPDAEWVTHFVASYGYAAIFLIVMMESAGVPLPGETTLVSAAVYAGTHHALDIRYVIAAAAAGAIFGDNIGYWVGRTFGTR